MNTIGPFTTALAILVFSGLAQAGTIAGKVAVKGARDARDVVVYVDAIPNKAFEAPRDHATMNQKNLVFLPHVLPVLAGTTVDFLNSDDVLHNVFTPEKCAAKFNLGTWPKGQVRSHLFAELGCAAVMLCNVHPEMEAYVLVLPTPYFATTDKEGKYAVEGVPAGTYTAKVWHEKLKKAEPVSLQVVVPGEGTVQADFTLQK